MPGPLYLTEPGRILKDRIELRGPLREYGLALSIIPLLSSWSVSPMNKMFRLLPVNSLHATQHAWQCRPCLPEQQWLGSKNPQLEQLEAHQETAMQMN